MTAVSTLQAALLLSALATNPVELAVCDRVELIEVNHFYDESGKHVFDQLIFYDWCEATGRHEVRAWRLLKKPTQYPRRDEPRGTFTALWHDGDVLRSVEARAIRETWTQHDPELSERQALPKNQRRELAKLRWAAK
jgi:hypothetical protein